jgi:UDP-4-amino-4-deoxy-L-arabinose formyltransferase/UDP-glucuronic acid dehydrogenase (UDP-4-keto-hexauronic acid decarboxylating)
LKSQKNRIIIAGNHIGISQLLQCIPKNEISAMIVPYNRPESVNYLKFTSFFKQIPLIVHPDYKSKQYPAFLNIITEFKNNILISNSNPLIFKKNFLDIFKNRTFNVHSSLLPKNRGCDPIQWAIMKNGTITGVTIHKIDYGVDTGSIVAQTKVEIDFEDTWISLSDKIQKKKIELMKMNYNNLKNNNFITEIQDLNLVTKNKCITEKDLKIDFNNISPSNPAFTIYENKKIFFGKFVEFNGIQKLRKSYL